MPHSIRSFDRVTIPAPCDADWDSMIGNDRVRLCEHCNLHVTNLSSLTRQEARRLVARSEGRLCVRFGQRPDGTALTKQMPHKFHQIGHRVSRVAAGAFMAALSVATAAAQSEPLSDQNNSKILQVERLKAKPAENSASISGTVCDPNGAVVPNAAVTLTRTDTNDERTATTSDEGEYRFDGVAAGAYKIRIVSPGFKSLEVIDINFGGNSAGRFDATLEMAEAAATMGVVAMAAPEEPLVRAAFNDDAEAVEQLAFASANLDVRDPNTGMTALDAAVENNNLEIVRILLRAGSTVNAKNNGGRTALMHIRDDTSVELVRELISAGAKLNARDESGGTALMAAAESKYDVVKELVDAGAKIDCKDANGKTALMFAATNSDPRIAKLLIDHGADLNAADEEGATALMLAAEEGDPETVKLLISFNADVNAIDKNGRSALLRVAGTTDLESAEALLNAGADVSLRDKEGKTALGLARAAEHQEMIKLLESRGAPE
jgi:ankyrin repeat protein